MKKETFDKISTLLAEDDSVSIAEFWRTRNLLVEGSSPNIEDFGHD